MKRSRKVFLMVIVVAIISIASFLLFFREESIDEEITFVKKETVYNFERIVKGKDEQQFNSPLDIAVTQDGTMYIVDSGHNRIQVYDQNGDYLFEFGGLIDDENNLDNYLNYPVSIALDNMQNLYVVDLNNQRIAIFDQQGQFIKNFVSEEQIIVSPTTITIFDETLYLFDKFDHQIKVFTLEGRLLNTFGLRGSGEGQFQYPFSITVDKEGYIFVSDTGNGRIQIFNQQGEYLSAFRGSFGMPSGISIDEENSIFISDPINSKVVITDQSGREIKMISNINDNEDHLYFPEGIEVTNTHLYIVDKGNNRVVIFRIDREG